MASSIFLEVHKQNHRQDLLSDLIWFANSSCNRSRRGYLSLEEAHEHDVYGPLTSEELGILSFRRTFQIIGRWIDTFVQFTKNGRLRKRDLVQHTLRKS